MNSLEQLWTDVVEILPWRQDDNTSILENAAPLEEAAIELFRGGETETPRAQRIRWALGELYAGRLIV